jgi:hypothetical protein
VHIFVQFFLCTVVSVYTFLKQYGFYRGVTEDDAGGEQAVDDSEEDLDYATLACVPTLHPMIHTQSLPPGHFKCAYRCLFASLLRPCTDRVEAHLPVPRVRARLSTPRLVLLHRRHSLRERHAGRMFPPLLQ